VYGSLDPDLVNELLKAKDPGAVFANPEWNRKATSGFISIFTPETTAPLVIATGLIALGWIIALPPWKAVIPTAEATVATVVDAPSQAAPGSQQSSTANPQQPLSTPQTSPIPTGQQTTAVSQSPVPAQTGAQTAPVETPKNAASPPVIQNKKPAPAESPVSWLNALYPDDSPVYFAFLGSYFFGIQMLFRRYVLKDLRTSAYVAVSLRIILAVLGTWVLIPAARVLLVLSDSNPSKIHTDSKLLVLGFVIGVFPRSSGSLYRRRSRRSGA